MSCMLRASGDNFDVDAFLSTCALEPVAIFKKGEPRFKASQPDGPKLQSSGLNFEASAADFSELEIQMEDALLFLQEQHAFITGLREFPGVESVCLDFGAEIHPPGWCSFNIPSKLMLACGSLGVSLKLSVYPIEEEIDESA